MGRGCGYLLFFLLAGWLVIIMSAAALAAGVAIGAVIVAAAFLIGLAMAGYNLIMTFIEAHHAVRR